MGTTTSVFLVYLLVLAAEVLPPLLGAGLLLTIAFSRRWPCGIIRR
jgi:hypothetical protein